MKAISARLLSTYLMQTLGLKPFARSRPVWSVYDHNPSEKPAWLTEQTYVERIQPRLAMITISALSSALGVSESYAADIRKDRHRPHPRHWDALAKLVGVSVEGESN